MPYKPNISTFDRIVSFCVPVTTKSAMGAPSKTYVHSFHAYMSRVPYSSAGNPGQEKIINNRVVVPNTYTYKGHYNAAINETLQISDNGIKFNILSVNAIERNMFTEIVAEKITE